MVTTLFSVALGGALGASARFLTGAALMRALGPGFPYATLAVNVLGSFAMGALVVVLAQTGQTKFSPFLMTGLLGGFTTFSAFSLDAVTLYERGDIMAAGLYVGASVLLSIFGLMAGLFLMRGLFT